LFRQVHQVIVEHISVDIGHVPSCTTGDECYYAASGFPPRGCVKCPSVEIMMRGKNSCPKRRRVCEGCAAWAFTEELADKAPAWAAVPPPVVRTVPISEFLWIPAVCLVCS
jgi:hypothetical protein